MYASRFVPSCHVPPFASINTATSDIFGDGLNVPMFLLRSSTSTRPNITNAPGSFSMIDAFLRPPAMQLSSADEPEPRTFARVTLPALPISSQYTAEPAAAGARMMQSVSVASRPLSAPRSFFGGSVKPRLPSSKIW